MILAAAAVTTTVLSSVDASAQEAPTTTFAVQLVTVGTPTSAQKQLLSGLGLDLTEHAGHDFVEVILHSPADAAALRAAGLTWQVRIPDLARRSAEIRAANEAYAAAVAESPLPSRRTTYRKLEDYNTDLRDLAATRPDIVKLITLNHPSLEGKTVHGVEIGQDVRAAEDGRPVFLMLGLHHAREWPSGEHSIEFAFDLVRNHGRDERITDLLNRTRVVVVPVVNVDGFEKSVNDGALIDLREVDNGGTVSILATPGNAYKRKNCRVIDGTPTLPVTCTAATSPGGYGVGVDPNRNYGGFWGGPGAGPQIVDPTYRGARPFSEPETQNIRELVAGRQVTTLVTNHTFSNLVLRPNGVHPDTIGPDGHPVGNAPDEARLAELGARMTAQNGYQNIRGWELYDTTGTTEDWSYNATGGFGYTFEIGANEFHPPFEEVVAEYLGAGAHAGKGNREAYLIALENAADPATHSLLTGTAPAGATLRLQKTFPTPTWEGVIEDSLDTTMVVGSDGRYSWHVNPSTRPVVQARQIRVTSGEPLAQQTYSGTTLPTQQTDEEFVVDRAGVSVLEVELDWLTPDDMDLHVFRKNADGSLTEVGSSAGSIGEKERVLLQNPQQGTYVLRVVNFASVAPTWTMTAALYDTTEQTVGGLIESWTLSCEKNRTVLERVPVVVDRGGQLKIDLRTCLENWESR